MYVLRATHKIDGPERTYYLTRRWVNYPEIGSGGYCDQWSRIIDQAEMFQRPDKVAMNVAQYDVGGSLPHWTLEWVKL